MTYDQGQPIAERCRFLYKNGCQFAIRTMRMGARIHCNLLIIGCLFIAGCANVKVTGRRELAAVPEAKPRTIYVTDFGLDPQTIKLESGLLPFSPLSSTKSDESETLLPRLTCSAENATPE